MTTFWNLLKALIYIVALLSVVGGGLCAGAAVLIPVGGTGEMVIYAMVVALIGVGVMLWVGRPRFAAGSAGEAILFLLLFMFLVMPAIQALAYGLGLGVLAPLLSLAALGAVIYFLVRRHKAFAARPGQNAEAQAPEQPPQA